MSAPSSSEAGFSLVEVLVSTVVLVAVLLVTLTSFERHVNADDAATRVTVVQDAARREVDALTGALRNATTLSASQPAVLRLGATEVAVSTYVRGTAAVRRYCVDASRALWAEQGPATAEPLVPTACPGPTSADWQRRRVVEAPVRNDAASPLFTLAADGRAIGVDLRLDAARPDRPQRTLATRSAAYLRSTAGRAPNVGASDVQVTCTTTNGRRTALLELAAGVGGGDVLGVVYKTTAGAQLGSGSVVVDAASPLQVAVTVTNALGLQTLLTRDVAC